MTRHTDGPIEDVAHTVDILATDASYSGFRSVETITYREPDVATNVRREIVRARRAVAVVAYDPALDRLVLIRQFRIGAQMGTGRGFCTEVVAGLIEHGNTPEQTAVAELREEAGLEAQSCHFLFSYLTTPGITDEVLDVFCCAVDASNLIAEGGLEEESERTFPFTCTLDDALASIDAGATANGILMLALLRFARVKEQLFG